MNANRFPNDPGGVFCAFELPKFGLTWAGANPFGEGFCVGSESGKLVLVTAEFQATSQELPASAAGEPVNSVAFSHHWLAVTTRKDINFIGPFTEPKRPPEMVSFSGGGPRRCRCTNFRAFRHLIRARRSHVRKAWDR